jgi:hypothetical protein
LTDDGAVVQRQLEGAVLQRGDDAAHRLLGVVLHMAHVGRHRLAAELRHHRAQLLHALFVGGDLRAQVGHVCSGLRAGSGPTASCARSSARAAAVAHQQEVVEQHAFLVDGLLNGGIEPGVLPPMSAWWPRLAT